MEEQTDIRRISYLVSIWAEHQDRVQPGWRGSLQTLAGQQFFFNTLAELNRLLCELGGWVDPPDQPLKPS